MGLAAAVWAVQFSATLVTSNGKVALKATIGLQLDLILRTYDRDHKIVRHRGQDALSKTTRKDETMACRHCGVAARSVASASCFNNGINL